VAGRGSRTTEAREAATTTGETGDDQPRTGFLRKYFIGAYRCRVVARVRSEGAGPPGSWTKECRREGERDRKQRDG
jgi:hypothetical protein